MFINSAQDADLNLVWLYISLLVFLKKAIFFIASFKNLKDLE